MVPASPTPHADHGVRLFAGQYNHIWVCVRRENIWDHVLQVPALV